MLVRCKRCHCPQVGMNSSQDRKVRPQTFGMIEEKCNICVGNSISITSIDGIVLDGIVLVLQCSEFALNQFNQWPFTTTSGRTAHNAIIEQRRFRFQNIDEGIYI